MNKRRLALASLALAGMLPLSANAAPSVYFREPDNGDTISGNLYQSSACEVGGSNIDRVRFYLDGTLLNTEENSPWNCNLDTRRFADGSHTLRAVAYDRQGTSRSTQIGVRIQNGTSPSLSWRAPQAGATLKGAIEAGSACEVAGSNVSRVVFHLDGTQLNTENSAPWNCYFDTRKFADGAHTLKAVAYGSSGASTTITRSVTIDNGTAPGGSAPTVSFRSPLSGATLSGYHWDTCEVVGSGFNRVEFSLDGTALNTKNMAPWNCDLKTPNFPDGPHTLTAVASNTTTGAKASTQVALTFKNGNVTSDPDAPKVSFKSPLAGQTITGAIFEECEAVGTGFDKVVFSVDGTVINTEGAAPYNCNLHSERFPDGMHTLMALATDSETGASASAQISLNFQNGSTSGDPATPPSGSLPSTGTNAVATFESLGLYWKPASNPGSAGCEVKFRKQGDSAWKQGLNLWYDSRNSECRGSIVHLTPGTSYEVQFALPGKAPSAGLIARTWSESFPIAKTVNVASGSGTLNITQGGTKDGYVLYTGPATLDAANGADHNVVISAPYVIVRGLTLKGARIHGIKLLKGAHDVVVENNDISGWGRPSGKTSPDGWKLGIDGDSAVYASCYNDTPWLERLIIQRNRLHHPRYGSNSWSDGHPSGPNAVHVTNCGGNHVWRYNEVYSAWGHYFNDGLGGGENFSDKGVPNADSDLYGNRIQHVWDDAIEAEGANNNVRIWGNYMDQTATGIATTSSSKGPVYIWRNVWNRSRNSSRGALDSDNRLYMFKSGSHSTYGNGRRYVFHNTMLQAPPVSGSSYPQGGGMGLMGPGSTQALTNTVSRNNIFHVWKTWWTSVADNGSGSGAGNDLDYDLVNGNVTAYSGAETHRVVGTPIFKSGHGWAAEGKGLYQLEPHSPGYDRGSRIPNFNDAFTGAAPDMGAHEDGMPAMKLGVQ